MSSRPSYPDSVVLRTSSIFHAWWLKNVHGYKVVGVRRCPKRGWHGRMRFAFVYKMVPGYRVDNPFR